MPSTLKHNALGFTFDVLPDGHGTFTLVVGWPTTHEKFQQPDEGDDDKIRICHELPSIEEAITVLWQVIELIRPSNEVRAAFRVAILELV